VPARALAEAIVGIERQPGLFDEPAPTEPVPIDLHRLHLERGRRFGDVWLGLRLGQALHLDTFLEQWLPQGRAQGPWAKLAAVLVRARFCEPSSELHIAEDWFRRTARGDLLGVADDKVNDDRLARALDRLLPYKPLLEIPLPKRRGRLFGLAYDRLLDDLTRTYFEGQAVANPQARRGHSRDHRPDCQQVLIGLVVSRDGYPLGYEVFAGNRNDGTTLRETVTRMEDGYGRQGRSWVLDRGMVSEASLGWLKGRGARSIVGTPRSRLKQVAHAVRHGPWEALRDGREVQRCADDAGVEPFILCRSAARASKEQALRERFVARIVAGRRKIRAAGRRRRCTVGQIERRVGRLLGKNTRAAGLFNVVVETGPDGRGSRRWRRRGAAQAWARSSDGCYVRRSHVADGDADELWRAYRHLTDAEAAVRIQKTELRVRPVWHQLASRVQAHVLVYFLASALRKTLEGWRTRAGLGNSPTTVLEELGRIQSTDVVAPTTDGRRIRLRCVVRPDKAQSVLLDHLGLELPQRLRLPRGLREM